MPKVWDSGRKDELTRRLESLQAGTRPQWGQFTAGKMLVHCSYAMLARLGEKHLAAKSTPMRFFPLNKLVIYALPWPKSAPTAPELIPADEPDFETAKAEFRKTFDRFIAAGPQAKFAPHAAFGAISGNDWGALMYRHIDHHWRQFGL